MSAIEDVKDMPGFNPLRPTPDNVHLCACYIPALRYEYTLIAANLQKQVDVLKARYYSEIREETMRLLARAQELKEVGGVRMGTTLIDRMAAACPEVTSLRNQMASTHERLTAVKSYVDNLNLAYTTTAAYLGHEREQIKLGSSTRSAVLAGPKEVIKTEQLANHRGGVFTPTSPKTNRRVDAVPPGMDDIPGLDLDDI